MKKFFDEKPGTSLLIGVCTILFIGALIFLFTKDNPANPHSVTGWQVLGMQNVSFWLFAVLITAVIGVAIYFIGKYLMDGGDSKAFGSWWMVMAIFLGVAWGKGCTDKANDGITAPGHKVEKPVDDGRVPAEDLLKQ